MNISTRYVRPLTYFLLTYLLSWLIWIPLDLSHFGIGPLHIPEGTSSIIRLLGVLMPATAALILSRRSGGRQAVHTLLQRLTLWKVGWKWYIAGLVLQPGLLILAGLAYNFFGGKPTVTPLPLGSAVGFIVNVVFLLLATLGEEIGWRGVALPALQLRRSAFISSAILGLLWGAWHIPFWLLLDTFDQFGSLYLLLNFLLVLPMSFFITWVFNHSRSSLLLPVLFHVTFNIINTALLPVTINIQAFVLFIVLEWIVVLLVIRRLEPAQELRD